MLWDRLSQHRGPQRSQGGSHNSSIFRHHVGTALLGRSPDLIKCPSWNGMPDKSAVGRAQERDLEHRVSGVIRAMPFVCLGIDDEPGPESDRGYIERNAIALLSNLNREAIDPPSAAWLGYHCAREKVRGSGLWNANHVGDIAYDARFIERLAILIVLI